MARSRRSGLVLALLIAAAAGASASQRGLAQYAYSPGKGKGKGALPVPLSVVSTAAYVQPALLTQNQQPVYRPAAVLPTDQIKDTFIQVKDKVASVGASVHNFMTMKKAPAAAAAPAVYAAPLAGPMAPIFASGQALPVVQPYQFVPKYKWYEFPFIRKTLTLGITAQKLPDPFYMPPTYIPKMEKGGLFGGALYGGGAAAAVPLPGAAPQYAQQPFQPQYAAPQYAGGAQPLAAPPGGGQFGLQQAAPAQMAAAPAAPQQQVVISQQPAAQMVPQAAAPAVNQFPQQQQVAFTAPAQPLGGQGGYSMSSLAPVYPSSG